MASSAGSLSHTLTPPNLATELSSERSVNDSVFVDLDALVRKLNDKQAAKLRKLIDERDVREFQAAEEYIKVVKKERLKKKKVQLVKKSRWRLWSRGYVDEKGLKADIDEELGNAVTPQCYEEIKRLLFIEKNPICAKALQEWSRKETLFTSRVERKKSKVADLKNEIYQLIGFFSVFQGVLLTAVSQSSLLHCNNLWSPILLSVVASVVTIFGVCQKLRQIEGFQKTIHSEEYSVKEVAARLNTLRNKGVDGFEFAQFEHRENKNQERKRFFVYFLLVVGSLGIFTLGFPISHWRILCHPGSSS